MEFKAKTYDDSEEITFKMTYFDECYPDEDLLYVWRKDGVTAIGVRLSTVVCVELEALRLDHAKTQADLDFCLTHSREDRARFEAHTRRIMQRSAELGLQRKQQIEALERLVSELLERVNAMEMVAPAISANRLDLVPA